jgi:hypothetical protein
MADGILVVSYSEISHRHAMLSEDGPTSWLYLHAPSDDREIPGQVDATCFAYNRIDPIDVKDVKKYRPDPPPIAQGYASDRAVCRNSENHRWMIIWSMDGEAVVLMRDDETWGLVSLQAPRGFSKAIQIEGPWGNPWSNEVYEATQWGGQSTDCT